MIEVTFIGDLSSVLKIKSKKYMIEVQRPESVDRLLSKCGVWDVPEMVADKMHISYNGVHSSLNAARDELKIDDGTAVTFYKLMSGG